MKTNTHRVFKLASICLLTPIPPLVLSSCSTTAPTVDNIEITAKCTHNLEYGGCLIDIKPQDFEEIGFQLGDGLNIEFSNNQILNEIPYFNGFYGYNGDAILLSWGSSLFLTRKNSLADVWKELGLTDEATAKISIAKKEQYYDIQKKLNISYTNNRDDYDSDEQYANFRAVNGGNLKQDVLYRGVTPISPKTVGTRYEYTEQLISDNGITFPINLSNSEDQVMQLVDNYNDTSLSYYRSLIRKKGKLSSNSLAHSYYAHHYSIITNDLDCRLSVADLFRTIIANSDEDSKFYVHCEEGKDRTGAICILIESLCGCSYDEILEDYMMSFENLYHLNWTDNASQLETIVKYYFNELVYMLTLDETRSETYANADFKSIAIKYLSQDETASGMLTDDEIGQIITLFSRP